MGRWLRRYEKFRAKSLKVQIFPNSVMTPIKGALDFKIARYRIWIIIFMKIVQSKRSEKTRSRSTVLQWTPPKEFCSWLQGTPGIAPATESFFCFPFFCNDHCQLLHYRRVLIINRVKEMTHGGHTKIANNFVENSFGGGSDEFGFAIYRMI